MSTPQFTFNDYLMFSLEEAVKKFHKTHEYELLKEKLEQMTEDCKNNFNEEDYDYVESCIEVMHEADDKETVFIYNQAFKDCIALLKELEVI